MKPDFSGEWVLDRPASELTGGAAGVETALLRIEHSEPVFRYGAKFVGAGRTMVFTFERRTDSREVTGGDGVSRLYWTGDVLVSEDRTGPPDTTVTMTWRYELLDGERRLRAREQLKLAGRDEENVWQFRRQ